jgi:hypothetical protein
MVDGAAGVTSDLNLRVFASNGTLEFDGGATANNDEPFGDFSGNVAGTVLSNVPTFLRIERPQAFGSTEPYRLYAVIQPHLTNATTEVEPNNNLGQPPAPPTITSSATLPDPLRLLMLIPTNLKPMLETSFLSASTPIPCATTLPSTPPSNCSTKLATFWFSLFWFS